MEILVTKGENKRIVLSLLENNLPFDVSSATSIVTTLTIGMSKYTYALGSLPGSGLLTRNGSLVGIPAIPEVMPINDVALYLEATETERYEEGALIYACVEVTNVDTRFPSGKDVHLFDFTIGRVIFCC